MLAPSLALDEPFRLQSLRKTQQLDTPLEERFERVTRLAQRLLNTPIAAISLVDADRQWYKSIQGLNIEQTSREISFCGHAILHDEVFVVHDARIDSRFFDNPLVTGDPHVVFYAGCPLRGSDGSRIGSLCVIDHQPRALSPEDSQTLRDLAAVVESELSESMQSSVQRDLIAQVDILSRQAQVDSLTRLWNRKSIFELLDAELARARRDGYGIGIIMADLDHFKSVNDTLGHAAGDEVLRQTAKRMLGAIREVDALGRYGGEEFLIVLGRCGTLQGAQTIAERIRARIAEQSFATEFGEIPATISLGVAFSDSATALNAKSLVQSADDTLYRAKHAGRNRAQSILIPSAAAPNP